MENAACMYRIDTSRKILKRMISRQTNSRTPQLPSGNEDVREEDNEESADLKVFERKKGKLNTSHRYNLLPLLPSGPGGIQRELVVYDLPDAKVVIFS